MPRKLCSRSARGLAEEASGRAIACWTRVLFLALELVLCGGVSVGSAMVADFCVGRSGAHRYLVAEAVASCALQKWFWGNRRLGRDPLVVHVSRLVEEFVNRRACSVVD